MKSWERLEAVIHWTGLSTHAFAMEIGLKRSENLYRIRREKNGISKKLAEIIGNRYKEINTVWLLTGEGDMLKSLDGSDDEQKVINCYERLNYNVINDLATAVPTFKIESSIFSRSDFGVRVDDHAMSPTVPHGSIVILKRGKKNFIVYGQMYYIVYNGTCLLRCVKKTDEEDKVLLKAVNPEYDDILIEKKNIEHLYMVMYVMVKMI